MTTHARCRKTWRIGGAILVAILAAGCEREAPPPTEQTHSDSAAPAAPAAPATPATPTNPTTPGAVGPVAHTHAAAGETCFICDPSKRDKGRLWCREHGRYEDRCWLCHPELEDADRLYCAEHFLYEDECFLCHPELRSDDAAARSSAADDGRPGGAALFCNEHQVAEAECGICQPDLAAALEPGQSMKVRLPSAAAADKAGIRTDRPRVGSSTPVIEALCEVQYDLNALAKVTPLVGGVIHAVPRDVGRRVTTGEVLAELHSIEAAAAKSDYLAAVVARDIQRQALERMKRLREQNIAAEKDVLQTEAAWREAELALRQRRQMLDNLGFGEREIARIERDQETSALLVVRAPFAGTLIERNAVVGEAVDAGEPMFTVADLSSRWLLLSVPAAHLTGLDAGQEVEAHFDELPGLMVKGRVTWIDASIDPRSRMIRARALVTEGVERLKTGLYGKARILTGAARPAAVVPREAVQRHGDGDYVFVRDEPDLFSLRRVALGPARGDSVEVLAGLDPAEAVVTGGSFIVMSEFLKSRLGAGCADH